MMFFVVKIIESNEIVVVPVHWYQFSDNKCAWPIKDAQNRAEREEVFSTWWPRYNAKVIPSHGKFYIIQLFYLIFKFVFRSA